MTRKSTTQLTPRRGLVAALVVLGLVAGVPGGGRVAGQTQESAAQALRQQVEQRFDVLVIRDALVLKPKSVYRDVRWVEVSDGAIAVNGTPVSGAELRDRLGDDAVAVLQLTYLDPAVRAALFRDSGNSPGVEPSRPEETPRRSPRAAEGGQFKVGGDITVNEGDVVAGDLVMVGGTVHVFGEVRGDVVGIGGTVDLGPASRVSGDVVAVGGSLRRDPSARVGGDVTDVASGSMGSWRAHLPGGRWREPWAGRTFGSAVALVSTLARVAILCLLSALVMLFGRDYVARISARAAAEPLKAGAIGFLAQLLALPLLVVSIVLLIVTIIGIPLLALIPFVLLALAIVALVGFTAVASQIGHLLHARFAWVGDGPYASTMAGIVVLVSPLLLARLLGLAGGVLFPMVFGLGAIGTILEYLAWTVGFGAVALVRFHRPGPGTLGPPAPVVGEVLG